MSVAANDRDETAGRNDLDTANQSRTRPRSRDAISEGAVWFSAAIGRQKNADARWLLPMICRRGGIDKHEIGKINILDTTTEFEISGVRPPRSMRGSSDRIKRTISASSRCQGAAAEPPREKPSYPPRRDAGADRGDRPNDRARDERGSKPYGKPAGGSGPGFAREPGFDKKKKYAHKPAYAGSAPHAGAADGKPAFGKKKKKNCGG